MPTSPYALTEHVAAVCPNDFARISPLSALRAAGSDGSVGAGADRWRLASASSDFVAQGVVPGMTVEIARANRPNLETDRGYLYAVGEVVSATVLLFRPLLAGQGEGVPQWAASATSMPFRILSVEPWIAKASDWLDARLRAIPGVDDAVPSSIFPDAAYREVTARQAASDLYLISARNAATINDADQTKADAYKQEVVDWLARVEADYVATTGVGPILAVGKITVEYAEDAVAEFG